MEDTFGRGMERWFAFKGFQMGMPTEDIDQSSSVEDFESKLKKYAPYIGQILQLALSRASRLKGFVPGSKRLVGVAKRVGLGNVLGKAGSLGGAVAGQAGKLGVAAGAAALLWYLVETKTTAADFYEALKPYMSEADMVGLKISNARVQSAFREHPENKTFWNTVIVPVIYADRLTPELIMQRLDKFLQASTSLKRLGLRAKFIGNRAHIYPLLVYFDSKKLEEDGESLWPQILEEDDTGGVRPRHLRMKAPRTPEFRTYLSAGMVNVSGKRVVSEIFDEDDLHYVLEWGQNDRSNSDQF